MTRKICFCFLVYDTIIHEEIWKHFFTNVNCEYYRVVIHYKHQKELKYYEHCKMKHRIPTEYGKVSVVNAQNLMTTIYPDCSHYIMLSGVCIPLKTFDYVYNFLKPGFSYFNYFEDHHNFPRCNTALKYLKKEQIK